MVKFNRAHSMSPSHAKADSELSLVGTILFHGPAQTGCGCRVLVNKGAVLSIGKGVHITDNINLDCQCSVTIGDYTGIAHRCQVMDSNHHFTFSTSARKVLRHSRPIVIGERCWIANSVSIMGGAVIPDYTIVASNSLVNGSKKDIATAPPGSIIGGIPAKVISSKGTYRIFNMSWEGRLSLYFEEHPEAESYTLPENVTVEELTARDRLL